MAGLTDYQGTAGIVTGASSGIGAQLARDLAARGMRVALRARRADRLAALADEIRRGGGVAIAVPCDVAERTSIEGAVAGVLERFGRVDLLVNDAGYGRHVLFKDHDTADIERMTRTNYLGVVWVPGRGVGDQGSASRDARPAPRLDRQHLLGGGQARSAGRGRVLGEQVRRDGPLRGALLRARAARHPRDDGLPGAGAHRDVHARGDGPHAARRGAHVPRAARVLAPRPARAGAWQVRGHGAAVHRDRVPGAGAATGALSPHDGAHAAAGAAGPDALTTSALGVEAPHYEQQRAARRGRSRS